MVKQDVQSRTLNFPRFGKESGRRILVTGGAGFIGSHLVRLLLSEGAFVRVVDNFDPQVHSDGANRQTDGSELVFGDVADREVWDRALDGITEVVHFASSVGVGQSMYRIADYCRTNVMGTAYLLQAIADRKQRPGKLLVASSMSVYGEGSSFCDSCKATREVERSSLDLNEGRWEPICPVCDLPLRAVPTPESKAANPQSVYAINKRDQEEMCLTVGRAYGISTTALRFFNVYGPGQALANPYTGVATIFCATLLSGGQVLIFEDGLQSRDFVHVKDVVKACSVALSDQRAGSLVLNIGTGRPTNLLQLAAVLTEMLGGPAPRILEKYRSGDIRHCYADISAVQSLGWRPEVRLEEGIPDLVESVKEQVGSAEGMQQALEELRSLGLVS